MSSLIIRKAANIILDVIPKLHRIHGVVPRYDFIRTSDTMTRVLGRASSSYTITLNSKAFAGHEDSDSFANTVIHELCHLYEFQLKGKMSHSPFWKSLMVDCGAAPNRCFTAEEQAEIGYVAQTNRTKYAHNCQCQTHMIGAVIHRNILSGSKYKCKRCKSVLV